MYFELADGRPRFAIAKSVVIEQVETAEGVKEVQREVYIFTEEELSLYPDAVPVEQPTPDILSRAKQLEGKTLSKSEFERMLFSVADDDLQQRVADLEAAVVAILGGAV